MQGPSGRSRGIEAVVDTGFNGFLTLSATLVSELGVPFVSIGRTTLSDGSEIAYLESSAYSMKPLCRQ